MSRDKMSASAASAEMTQRVEEPGSFAQEEE
jgi:hypothetical protein